MEKQSPKAQYESPKIHEHGDVKKITLQGTLANSDIPSGPPNSAFS
jgi:hypothetical protein